MNCCCFATDSKELISNLIWKMVQLHYISWTITDHNNCQARSAGARSRSNLGHHCSRHCRCHPACSHHSLTLQGKLTQVATQFHTLVYIQLYNYLCLCKHVSKNVLFFKTPMNVFLITCTAWYHDFEKQSLWSSVALEDYSQQSLPDMETVMNKNM